MQFELTREYLEHLRELIEEQQGEALAAEVAELHPADLAEIVDELKPAEAIYLYRQLSNETGAEMLVELDEDTREELLELLSSAEIARAVTETIDSDDAVTVLSELPDAKVSEIIALIEDKEQASDLQELLNYEDRSAGGLMATELVKVRAEWTIARGIREMRRQAEELDEVYTIYVVDANDRLMGTLSLKKLLFSSSSIRTTIGEIFDSRQLKYINAADSAEEAAGIMEKYDLVALPVVDDEMRLLGRITIDDVVDVIKEEAERDYELASGISSSVESSDNWLSMSKARLPWLIIGLGGGLLSAQVIGIFESELTRITALMFFVPLIAAMGGNVGVQSSAIVVKGLANKSLDSDEIWPKLIKEVSVAIISSLVCGGLLLGYNLAFSSSIALSLTVSLALICVILFASIFGTLIPLMLNKLNIDPAVATGPFITTLNDIMGLTIYFNIANILFA